MKLIVLVLPLIVLTLALSAQPKLAAENDYNKANISKLNIPAPELMGYGGCDFFDGPELLARNKVKSVKIGVIREVFPNKAMVTHMLEFDAKGIANSFITGGSIFHLQYDSLGLIVQKNGSYGRNKIVYNATYKYDNAFRRLTRVWYRNNPDNAKDCGTSDSAVFYFNYQGQITMSITRDFDFGMGLNTRCNYDNSGKLLSKVSIASFDTVVTNNPPQIIANYYYTGAKIDSTVTRHINFTVQQNGLADFTEVTSFDKNGLPTTTRSHGDSVILGYQYSFFE